MGKLEDDLACLRLRYVARAARLAPPYVVAMLQPGAAATWRSGVLDDMESMYRQLAPKLDELGPPTETPARWEEFMKRWLGQWQLMVTRFGEKRMEQRDGEERGGLSGSSGGEFLCPDCRDDFPTLGDWSVIVGKLLGCGGQQFGSCATACAVNFHCRARAMTHLERGRS